MADIRAFRAHRYDLGRVGALSDVVAPPYDVIDAALQQGLYDRSPYNVIRLELNKEEAGDSANKNRYTRAGQFLRDWQQEGVVQQSFDKQFVRNWLTGPESGWDRNGDKPPPPLPPDIVDATRARYIEAYERISGHKFSDWIKP